MIAVSLSVFIFALFSIDIKPAKLKKSLSFSKDNTTALKGILALCVILCHLCAKVEYKIPFIGLSVLGVMAVGAFFFLSGYALYQSSNKYKDYFNGFLYKRFVKIFLPFICMVIVYLIFVCFIAGNSAKDLFVSFLKGYPVSNSWYVLACMYCYIVFWLAFKKDCKPFKISFIELLIYLSIYVFATAFIFKWADWWYKSILLFPLGVLFSKYKDIIIEYINKHYFLFFSTAIVMLALAYVFPAINNRFFKIDQEYVWLVNDILMALTFTWFVVIFISKFNLNNPVTNYLGKISYEIYLFHGLIMEFLLAKRISFPMNTHFQQELYSALVVILTVAVASLFHILFNKINKMLLSKK